MIRKNKSFRLQGSTIDEIRQIKEAYQEVNGIQLSDTKIVEMAIWRMFEQEIIEPELERVKEEHDKFDA